MNTSLFVLAGLLWLVWVVGLLMFRRRPELRVGALHEFVYPAASLVIALTWLASSRGTPDTSFLDVYMCAALIIGILLTLAWLLSLFKRDCGVMDVAYAPAVAVPVVVLLVHRGTWSPHEVLITALVVAWSARMALHIGFRNSGHGEDGRYAAWRRRFGAHWWWWSFLQVFVMQGVTVWLWSFGLIGAVAAGALELGWQHAVAVPLFLVGFTFQTVGDLQLERFKKIRSHRSQVLDSGLWALSRHPNYFGEAVVWWSFGVLGMVQPWGWLALICPAYVTWFMSRGSATPMQERYLTNTKPAYTDYMRRVPIFFPWGGSR